MDSDILKIEEIVMGGGETATTADLNAEKIEQPYTTILIQNPSVPANISSCKNCSLAKVYKML